MIKKIIVLLIGILAGYLLLIGLAMHMGLASGELVIFLGLGFLSSLPVLLLSDDKKKICSYTKVKQKSL
ncbi:hypothetical protein [Chryseotalea sanaruensis]|uniref:hypothetical protein n=1 Tax=Chryseotalea sanaruensis TaxID=2482724 RepID=UPI000F8E7D21|nr:hypothetical protein [Chryseotalea sanaruensis]